MNAQSSMQPSQQSPRQTSGPQKPRSNAPLIWIIVISLIPVIAAFVVYYYPSLQPEGQTNYGSFVQPQKPLPGPDTLKVTTLDGKPFDLETIKGQWVFVTADNASCEEDCAKKLFIIRNVHAMTGKNVERLARVWFVTDDEPVPEKVLEAYKGTLMLRADPEQLAQYLDRDGLEKSIWIIDPLGNLIMQYPEDPDPLRIRKDIGKLLHNSRIG
ncbi:SCO family protein [Orrella marina]